MKNKIRELDIDLIFSSSEKLMAKLIQVLNSFSLEENASSSYEYYLSNLEVNFKGEIREFLSNFVSK